MVLALGFGFALAAGCLADGRAGAPGLPPENPEWEDPDWTQGAVTARVASAFDGLRVDGRGAEKAQVRVLTDNVESWFARWWLIDNARRTIDITYFIVENDVFGRSLLGLLSRKARAGVKIRFMVDSRGSKAISSVLWGRGMLKALTKLPGVEVRVFNPLHKALLRLPKDLRYAVASNHDKLLLVDDEWVMTGGRNIADEYFAHPEDMAKAYRDTDILCRGAAIAEKARKAFDEEFSQLKNDAVEVKAPVWTHQSLELELAAQVMERWIADGTPHPKESIGWKLRPRAEKLYDELEKLPRLTGYRRFEPFPDREEHPAIVLDRHSKAAYRRDDIAPALVELFDAAEHSILIQNPYVLLTKDLAEALIRACRRGVKVVLHTNSPASSDNVFTQAFFLRDWKRMLADMPGARILVFPGPQPLHAKVFVIDDRVTMIGTYNLDPLSREVNSEVMVAVLSESFAKENRRRIAADLAVSKEYKIRREADGRVVAVVGPEQDLSGLSGFFTRLISKLGFLKKMV